MASCELAATCIFFNDQMANMPSTASVYKKLYCEGDFDKCGRHMIFRAIGRENVPKDLFPNQSERANAVINGYSGQ